jgi:CheY-like chemotaxis protein
MKERILVVDDERDAADSLVRLIQVLGYEAKAAYDGEEALREVASYAPDMALIDIGMPGLNGFETVSRIRQQRGNATMILVAVTGWTREEDQRKAYDAGFDLHVAKPMTVETLKELLAILDPEAIEGNRPGFEG